MGLIERSTVPEEVDHDAVALGIQPRHGTGEGGARHRDGRERIGKADAVVRESIDGRRQDGRRCIVGADVVAPQGVDRDQEDIRWCGRRRAAHGEHGQDGPAHHRQPCTLGSKLSSHVPPLQPMTQPCSTPHAGMLPSQPGVESQLNVPLQEPTSVHCSSTTPLQSSPSHRPSAAGSQSRYEPGSRLDRSPGSRRCCLP